MRFISIVAVLALTAVLVQADSITVPIDVTTYLNGGAAATLNNYGTGSHVQASPTRAGLFKIAIPAEVTGEITAVTLNLTVSGGTGIGDVCQMYAITQDWPEGTGGTTSSCWATADGTNPWNTAWAVSGGFVSAGPYDAGTSLGQYTSTSSTAGFAFQVSLNAAGVALANQWRLGAAQNYGVAWLLTSGTTGIWWASEENATTSYRPTVTFTWGAASNTAPSANNDSYSTPQDTTLAVAAPGVMANDTDVDAGDTVTVNTTPVVGVAHGTLALSANGSFTYTPAAGYTGADSFTYQITDGEATDTAVVSITVQAVPSGDNLLYDGGFDEQTAIFPGVIAGNVWSSQATYQWTSTTGLAAAIANNQMEFNNAGAPQQIFQLVEDVNLDAGTVLLFSVTVSGTSTAATTWYIMPRNEAEVAAAYASPDTVGVAMTANAIQATDLVNGILNGVNLSLAAGTYNGLTVSAKYTVPTTAVNPRVDADVMTNLALRLVAGNGTLIMDNFSITVEEAIGSPPVANDDTASTNEGVAVAISVLANDTDPDNDTLTVINRTNGTNGTTEITGAGTTVTYTPTGAFAGQDTFTYTITDGNGNTDMATVTVTVNAVSQHAPVADDDSYTTLKNTTLVVAAPGVLDGDTDAENDPLSVDTAPVTAPLHGTLSLLSTGAFTYTPATDYTGIDTFEYTVRDANGSDTGLVTIMVNDPGRIDIVKTAYIFSDGATPDNDNYGQTIQMQMHHSSATIGRRGMLEIDLSSIPVGATITGATLHLYINAAIAADGHVIEAYRLTHSWVEGTGTGGGTGTGTGVSWDNYDGVNPWTAAGGDYDATSRGSVAVGIAQANSAVTMDLTSLVQEWYAGTNPNYGIIFVDTGPDSGDRVFFASEDHTNAAYRPYIVVDYTVVTNVAPVATNDSYSTARNTTLNVAAAGVLVNDTDADSDPLTAIKVTDPSHGTVTLNANGSFTYTPTTGYSGPDSFTYKANDGTDDSNTATVNITVTAPAAAVQGVYAFYNQCSFDGNNVAANASDDNAIAMIPRANPDAVPPQPLLPKTALLPGQIPSNNNVITFFRGINGIMVDVSNLAGTVTASDFVIKYSGVATGSLASNYTTTAQPGGTPTSVSVRTVGGNSRVTLIFPNFAVNEWGTGVNRNSRWMQVTVLANANTGLATPYVFYFGLAISDTGNSTANFQVTSADQGLIRTNPRTALNPAPIDFKYDINRDGTVTATDQALSRTYITTTLNNLLKYATAAP